MAALKMSNRGMRIQWVLAVDLKLPLLQKTTSKSVKRWLYVRNFLFYKLCIQCLKIHQVRGERDGPHISSEEEI